MRYLQPFPRLLLLSCCLYHHSIHALSMVVPSSCRVGVNDVTLAVMKDRIIAAMAPYVDIETEEEVEVRGLVSRQSHMKPFIEIQLIMH
jgi:hypothetical protein